MNTSHFRKLALGLMCWIVPLAAQAWWHDDWAFRKQLSIDTSPAAGDIAGSVTETQILVRLHTGNFAYFLDVKPNGEDLRFVDGDDKTPLKYHIERFDPINQMALIWVHLPSVQGGTAARQIWMYYGNPEAVAGGDAAGSYDTPQALVLHFSDPQALGQDATAYGNHAQIAAAGITEGVIGGAAGFDGSGGMSVPAGRGLQTTPESGFTLSAWVKIDAEQTEARVLGWSGAAGQVDLQIVGATPHVRISDASGAVQEMPASLPLTPGQWYHLAVVGDSESVTLYLNGEANATLPVAVPALEGPLTIGAAADGSLALVGQVDEAGAAAVARSTDWIRFAARAQAADARLLAYGEDGQNEAEGGHSAFGTILRNVTVDGWVVIVILAIMGAISWVVMFSKGAVINRTRRDNQAFLEQFAKLGATQVDTLDSDDVARERDGSPLLTALWGRHKHFESSNIYRLYHAGVQEMHHRTPKTAGAQAVELTLTPQAIGAIKATMDGALTRELQKLNSQMVLLTIAISGGPFLGLLGTVVGVMIVFAEIAAVGDVNVNAIAPGIAAALVATAAGVGVAIPALFGYNYLGSRIKEVSADMHVFVDEFVAKIAEQHS